MPETYAHLTFGEKVLDALQGEAEELITSNRGLYAIGLHGPDIFYYYKPYRINPVNSLAREIHQREASGFFQQAAEKILASDKQEAATAYLAGCISHFMLDSECHPYVYQRMVQGFSHSDIELEFDREMMLRDGLNPYQHKPTEHLITDEAEAALIAGFYSDITPAIVTESVRSMRRLLNWFIDLAPVGLIHYPVAAWIPFIRSIKDRIMSKHPIPGCAESNEVLHNLYEQAVMPTAALICEYVALIQKGGELHPRFDRNYLHETHPWIKNSG